MNQSDKERINQLDGLKTEWYENGQKKNEGTYKNGEIFQVLNRWMNMGPF